MRSAAASVLAAASLGFGCGSVATGPLDGGTRDAGVVIASRACEAGPSVTCFAELDVRFQAGALALDDANVYWVAAGQNVEQSVVLQAGRAGGAVITLTHAEPTNLATDGQFVYMNLGGARVPVGGGTVTTLGLIADGCMAVDDTSIYWTSASGVLAMPKGGGTATMLAAVMSDIQPGPVALDSEHVYWGGPGVHAVSKAGGVATTVVPGVTLPSGGHGTGCRALAVAGSTIYAVDRGVDTLVSAPTTGAIATVLDATSNDFAVVAGARIYSIVRSPVIAVNATPLDGGPAVTLATPATFTIHDIALASDGTLYWTTDTQVQSIKP